MHTELSLDSAVYLKQYYYTIDNRKRFSQEIIMPSTALSTWSIHNALGSTYRCADDGSDRMIEVRHQPGVMTLLGVPARMASLGIRNLEICHFHFPSVADSYIDALRSALEEADISLYSILIDAGDITHPDENQREADLAWIRSWLDIAGRCGATHARIIAGEAEAKGSGELIDHPAVRLSAENLTVLAAYGKNRGVQVITENFRRLTRRPEPLLAILRLCEGALGLCVDFGNYPDTTRYDDLAAILPHATSIHAKPEYDVAGVMERSDFIRCLDLARDADFEGPYSLIFSGEGDEWQGVAGIRDVVTTHTRETSSTSYREFGDGA